MLIPQPIVEKIVTKGAEFVPVVGNVAKYSRKAVQLTKIADPVTATSRSIGTLIGACTGPVILYPSLCFLWSTTGIIGFTTGSPIFIAMSIDFGTQIIEDLIE